VGTVEVVDYFVVLACTLVDRTAFLDKAGTMKEIVGVAMRREMAVVIL